MVAAQIVAGLVVSLLCWLVSGRSEAGFSALYGAACIVLPTAVLAGGIARLPASGPAAAAVGFMVWEGVKMLLTLAMLALAVKVVAHLSWPALLAALVACLSMNWLALSRQGRSKKTDTGR